MKEALALDRYPAIQLLLRHRQLAILLASALPLLIGGYLSWRGASIDPLVIALVLAAVAFVVVRVLVELVAIVVETLMPTI
jgi:hypothetical protein